MTPSSHPARVAPAPLDELDRRIVAALQVDGRAPWRLIAETLGEPERTVTRRGTRLLEEGIVRVAAINVRGSGVIVRAQSAPGMLRVGTRAWASRPDSTFVYLLTGVAGAVAEIHCPPSRMPDLVVDELPGTPGVTWCTASPIVHYYKTVHDWRPGILSEAETRALRPGRVPATPVSNEEPRADSADQALRRFTSCVLQSGVDLPYTAIRHGIGECVQLLVHLERREMRRLVTELVHVRGYDPERDRYDLVRVAPAGPLLHTREPGAPQHRGKA